MADRLAMVCSSGRSARDARAAGGIGAGHQQRLGVGIQVVDLPMTNSGPVCTTFFTVQRSMERRMPWRSFSEMSAGSSTRILKICR